MNIQEIKTIKLQDFLASLGHTPVKQQGNKLWYLSPFRTERQASFKVNTELNQWYDFGVGKGGNIIALAEALYKSSDVSYLIRQIERNVPSCVHSLPIPCTKKESQQHEQPFENLKVLPLAHPALVRYLHERCIDMEVATAVREELHYDSNGKHYFGIGFPNSAGGYEVRNPFFKGCIAPKDISIFYANESKKICFLFEGFMDFLSFMTLRKLKNPQRTGLSQQDYIVLNSVSNIHKVTEKLSHYDSIQCYLDNDDAGRNAYQQLAKELGDSVSNCSTLYNGFKDFNEYLCAEIKQPEKAEIKRSKGLRL